MSAVPPASAQADASADPGGPPVLNSQRADSGDDEGDNDESAEQEAKLRDAYYWNKVTAPEADPSAYGRPSDYQRFAGTVDESRLPTRGGHWNSVGPDPIIQQGRTTGAFEAVSGRIGALAIRADGTIILGAAHGGVWTYNADTGQWTPRLGADHEQAVGALAIAPSNDNVVYMGSGEGSLSGDASYGDGFYRSTDGGVTWQHVSTLFAGQAVSAIAVDPTNASHVFASTVRGRAGLHRTTAPSHTPFGVYESTDGGQNWTLLKGTNNELHGATSVVIDPQNPEHLFASFWGDAIYRSLDGGQTWQTAMGGLPDGDFSLGATRFALGISHPAGDASATLYTGFDYYDANGKHVASRVWKTTDNGNTWVDASGNDPRNDSVVDYCSTQCYYDNVIAPDPSNPDVVYALGCYGYGLNPPSGGVYRSTDGGAHWENLGLDLHPDFHAFAFQQNPPTDPSQMHIAIGNDGGVWDSHTGGGRNGAGDTVFDAQWTDLNGTVDPNTLQVTHNTGLRITQFESLQTVPNVPGKYFGGTQDNGTLESGTGRSYWYDLTSGDGGVAVVDPTKNGFPTFGEYYGISPYRIEANAFYDNPPIDDGINPGDRSEFYAPWALNDGNTNQMFYGTYRVYRSDNVETPNASDVHWTPISPDLTAGCLGQTPGGGRGCTISTLAVADGGTGVYAGTEEGRISVSPDATTAASPSWQRTGTKVLPERPVNQIVTDRSNWRIAYAAYSGFNADTTGIPGHVFATTDGGNHWKDISGNLPDSPANTVVLDPASPNTLYVGTDIGAYVTYNGGKTWFQLGQDMPKQAVVWLDDDPSHALLAAGTHGRGAYTLDLGYKRPALVVSKVDSGDPVGPGSTVKYQITVRNIGNAEARSVTITDPLPKHTNAVSISGDGSFTDRGAVWRGISVPAGSSRTVAFSVRIDQNLSSGIQQIVNDGIVVQALGQHVSTTGSPHSTPIAPANAVSVSPSTDTQAAKDGGSAVFHETVTNEGYQTDQYTVSASGSWTATVYDSTCTTPLTTTDSVAGGQSVDLCVKVAVPADAADNTTSDTTLRVASVADPSVSDSATLTSIAVQFDTLLVDEDGNNPDVASYYEDALSANGTDYSYWDLAKNPVLPQSYVTAHENVVWFTGNSYPDPVGPYEGELAAFLDGGGRLFMSGQDILDQSAGTAPFVKNYLHIDWDGTEAQNDKATSAVHGVGGNPVTDSIGSVPLDHSVLSASYEDEITPIAPATAAFTDDASQTDALTVADGSYKVMFLAFPFEAYGSAAQKADLMNRALTWLDS